MVKPRIMWFAERVVVLRGEMKLIREKIGEFSDFARGDERQRWKDFVDSKGGPEIFMKRYPRITGDLIA